MPADRFLTIGEFSRRVGVSIELLRVWERRYGVPKPARAPSGRRLYTREDERTVAEMQRAVARGLPARAAASHAATIAAHTALSAESNGSALDEIADGFRDALIRLSEADAQEHLDRLFVSYSIETSLRAVVLPCLHDIGERWAASEITIGDEHFATNLIHGRLLSLTRKWDDGHGPRALLACPPGELHTIGLLAFGLSLRRQGWRITYLGADTPTAAIADVAGTVNAARIVLSSVSPDVFRRAGSDLADIASATPISIGGAGASPDLADAIGATALASDPVTAAADFA